MTGGPYIVFTRKAVIDETFIKISSNVCKSIVGIVASQLYNRTRNFENMVMSFYRETKPECEIESFFTSGEQKNN